MFKHPFLSKTFFASIIIVIILPAYSTFIIYPAFTALLIQDREDEATRTASHLLTLLLPYPQQLAPDLLISDRLDWEAKQIVKDFKLMKIKIFSKSGQIIYSTEPSDIGKINTESYFHQTVAMGKIFTKIIQKGNLSMEGQEMISDVVETYAPIMQAGEFKGAFEIYYDITNRKAKLDQVLFLSSVFLVTGAIGLLGIIMLILNKIGKTFQELQQAKEVAELATQAKSKFIAYLSHEIRNPINGLLGTLSVVLDDNLTEKQRDKLGIAYRNGDMLLSLLNNVLDFSKITAGKLELEAVSFNLPQTVQETIQLLKDRAQTKGLELVLQIAPQLPRWVKGDPTRLRQILINLLSNSIKFTPQGTVTISIHYVTEKPALFYFEVQDTGIGIAPEVQTRLFQPFTQADQSINRRYGGSGLGLSLVRQFVELMGGEMGVRTQLNQGSTFWFKIPLQPMNSPLVPSGSESKHQQNNQFEFAQVLLVEDSPINQQITIFMLKKLGLQVTVANNGQEAVIATEKQTYDLILMDYQMPIMDGYAAALEIRHCETNPNHFTPIITITGSILELERQRFRQAGINDFLIKPFKFEDLTRIITPWLIASNHNE